MFINPRHICCYYLISHNNHVTCDSCPDAFGTNLGTFHFFSEKLWGFSCYNLFKHLWTLLEGCLPADLFTHVVRRWWTQGWKFLSWIRMTKYFLLFLSFGSLDSEVKCTHITEKYQILNMKSYPEVFWGNLQKGDHLLKNNSIKPEKPEKQTLF